MKDCLLDICMIVRDEEKRIQNCLRSFASLGPLLGETCVYDTGSLDETLSIARKHGCVTESGFWDHDFARARNASIALSKNPWFLTVDADEEIVVDSHKLKDFLLDQDESHVVYLVAIVSFEADGVFNSSHAMARLGRRGQVRFKGAIHETLVPTVAASANPVLVPPEVLHIAHFGYNRNGSNGSKARRNVDVSSKAILKSMEAEDFESAALYRAHRAVAYVSLGMAKEAVQDVQLSESCKNLRYHTTWQAAVQAVVAHLLDRDSPLLARQLLFSLPNSIWQDSFFLWATARIAAASGDYDTAWLLISQVDSLILANGVQESVVPVLYVRMIVADQIMRHEDAVAAALTLFVNHGFTTGVAGVINRGWGGRPVSQLARLLSQTPAGAWEKARRDNSFQIGAIAEAKDILQRVTSS